MTTATTTDPSTGNHPKPGQQRVTDDATRMFHWLFALSFTGAYITADSEYWLALHMCLGYLMLGLLALRLIWGIFGPRRSRLTTLATRIKSAKGCHKTCTTGGHINLWQVNWQALQNALMALLVALLFATTAPLVLTGYFTHADIAANLMEDLHEFFGEFYLGLVVSHIAAISLISVWRQRNLAQPMVTGYTNQQGPDLVRHTHRWLALFLLSLAIAWVVYDLTP